MIQDLGSGLKKKKAEELAGKAGDLAMMTLPRTAAKGKMSSVAPVGGLGELPSFVPMEKQATPGMTLPNIGTGGGEFATLNGAPVSTMHLQANTPAVGNQAAPAAGALNAMAQDPIFLPSSVGNNALAEMPQGAGPNPNLVGLGGLLNKLQASPGNGTQLYAPNYNENPQTGALAAMPTEQAPGAPGKKVDPKLLGLNRSGLLKGLMATGLSMMDQGGRTTATPVSAGAILGRAGQVGMATYDQEKGNQQAAHLTDLKTASAEHDLQSKTAGQAFEMGQLDLEKAKTDLAGSTLDRAAKSKISQLLDELATETDPKKFAALSKRYQAMIGKSGKSGQGKTYPLQQVKEKVQVGTDPFGGPIYMEQTIGNFNPDPAAGGTVTRYPAGPDQYPEGFIGKDAKGQMFEIVNGKPVAYKG